MVVQPVLRHQRAITIAALVLLAMLAWAWIVTGAGMAMDPPVSIVPQAGPDAAMPDMGMPDMGMPDIMGPDMAGPDTAVPAMDGAWAWSPGHVVLVVTMWWVMMIAMMLPAATPTILLYARAVGAGSGAGGSTQSPATGAFLVGYLIVWGAFSVIATLLHMMLDATGLLSAMGASQSRVLSAIVLGSAGAYQLSPLKEACLNHCRSPARFLARHFRPGRSGALRMGVIHGTYCVGCCWLLMALLFVGGVMNLAWIALLTLLVAAEKLLPWGRAVAIVAGLGCIGWGIAILAL